MAANLPKFPADHFILFLITSILLFSSSHFSLPFLPPFSLFCPLDHMIKALLPRTHWGCTVIISDLLNNDHVDPLSSRTEWRVHQRHRPAWDVTDSGPPFLVLKFHIMSVIQPLQNAAAPGVILWWKNIIICQLLGKHFTVVSVIVMLWCECACMCIRLKERENVKL